jgi:predicted nucleotidyltransferase
MDLSPKQIAAIKTWARDTPQVVEVRLFGSRAKGTARPDSDVDLAVTADYGNYVALVAQWEDRLSKELGLDVRISGLPAPRESARRLPRMFRNPVRTCQQFRSERSNGVALANGHYNVFHCALLAPNFSGFSLTQNVRRVHPTGVLYLDNRLSSILIFHEKVWRIFTLVLLTVDPWNDYSVSLHPFPDIRIAIEPNHHPAFEVTVKSLEVPRAFFRIWKVATLANRHIR